MNQYLSHLANLAFNQLDVVQPRLASRFESNEETPVANFVEQESLRDTSVLSHAPNMQTTQQPTATPDKNRLTPTRADEESISEEPRNPALIPSVASLTAPVLPGVRREEKLEFSVDHQADIPQLGSSLAPSVPALVPQPISPAPVQKAVIEPGFKEEILEVNTPLLQPIKISSAPVQIVEREPKQAIETFGAPIAPEIMQVPVIQRELISARYEVNPKAFFAPEPPSETPTKTAPVKPEAIRVKPQQADFHSEAPQAQQPQVIAPIEQAAPSIHVSIGRIEIRANQTNAPAAAKSHTPTTKSLDDYLKQRNGERS